jgi:hypothetical protein
MFNARLFLSKIFLFIVLIQFASDAGPTQRYLEEHSLEEITQTFSPKLQKKVPLLLEIAEHETEDTFFGYHGMSQNNRLFQDILHVVFEEVLQISIPENFYFLRIPGEAQWNSPGGTENFFLSRKSGMSDFHKDLIIKNFLAILKRKQNVQLKVEDFTEDEYARMSSFFQDFIHYSLHNEWVKHAKKYGVRQHSTWAEPKFNEQLPELLQVIDAKLKQSYPETNHENICTWLSDHFADPFNIKWVFLLFELEDISHAKEIDAYFIPFDDTEKVQQSLLVAMNLSIFGNYKNTACCSAKIFLKNQSILNGDKNLIADLQAFFTLLGLDPEIATRMWEEGKQILEEGGAKHGCLLQFYDESALRGEKPFSFVDENAFVSFKHAIPLNCTNPTDPSEYIQGTLFLKNNKKDLELRLLMNNGTTLNPFSPLRMVRHDELSQKDSQRILKQMKQILRKSLKDEAKILSYKEALENMWNTTLR